MRARRLVLQASMLPAAILGLVGAALLVVGCDRILRSSRTRRSTSPSDSGSDACWGAPAWVTAMRFDVDRSWEQFDAAMRGTAVGGA